MHLLVASIFVMVNASPTIAAPAPSAEARPDTTFEATRDTAREGELRTFVEDSLLTSATPVDTTSRAQRPRAIEYSDAYHTRLKIHQIGAYAMLPLFISEYFVGQKLLASTNRSGSLKSAHSLIAGGVGIVFASNTVTGVWNASDARKDPKDRARREIHGVLMLVSDAGVVLTAMSGGNAKRSLANARRHRTIAISSIALSAVGTGMMWLWRK